MKALPRLLQQAFGNWRGIALTVVFGFAGGILTVFFAFGLSRTINRVFLENQDLAQVSGTLGVLAGLAVLRAILQWAAEISANAVARQVKHDLRQRLFQNLLELGPAYVRGERGENEVRSGELVNTTNEGIEALDAYFSQYLPQLALAALVPLTLLAFVLPLDPLSGLVLLLTAPLIPIFMLLIGSAAQTQTRRQWRSLSRMSAYFLDVLQGLTALKTLGRSREQIHTIARVSERYRLATMGVLRTTFLSALALELVSTLSTAVVAVQIGLRLLYGRLDFEQAFFILLLSPEFYLPLRLLGTRFHAGMAGVEAARRIFEILDIQPPARGQVQFPANDQPSPIPHKPPQVTFRGVHYTYADGRQGLRGVSFEVLPGQCAALVGPSGAGKSTIFSLLLCFLKPQSGQIYLDGIPLAEIAAEEWLSRVAWVPQNPYLFNDTIAANLRLAKPDSSMEEVRRAANLAQADDFIQAMPQGYETVIGERGVRLSAGEAQRIALARAFLKDAPLLLLDEPTSHLDPETEALLQRATQRLAVGRTVLVIAHRLHTLRTADQVIVVEDGKVTQGERPLDTAALAVDGSWSTVNASPSRESRIDPAMVAQPPPASPRSPADDQQPARRQPASLRLLRLLAPFTSRVALSALFGFATIGSSIGLMSTSAYLISKAALQPSIADLQVAIVSVRFFGLGRGLFRYLERLMAHDVTFRLLARWRTWFYQALEPLAPARLMGYHSGDLLSRVIGDIAALESLYVRGVAPPLVALLTGLVMCLFLLQFGAQFALTLLLFLLLAGIGLPLLIQRLSLKPGRAVVQARASLSTVLVDGIQGMADVLGCGQPQRLLERVATLSQDLGKWQTHLARTNGLHTALGGLLANLAMLVVLALGIRLVGFGELDGVWLGMLALAALTSFEAVVPIAQAAQTLETSLSAARRLFEIIDAQPLVSDPPAPLPAPMGEVLQVVKVSFSYPSDPSLVMPGQPAVSILEDISFMLSSGKHLALIGASGAGKTTLLHLLLRFWDPAEGSILLDGYNLAQYSQEDVRRKIAVVPQNPYLFTAMLRDNLCIARPQASQAEIEGALRVAQLDHFLASLPEGIDTWIGEEGLRLSAGQRQRIALARALLQDAPLLVLDEPTANLDPKTEAMLMESLLAHRRGRSLLLITHRLIGMEAMDEILVLQNGRIMERGRHAALLARDGLYRRAWSACYSS